MPQGQDIEAVLDAIYGPAGEDPIESALDAIYGPRPPGFVETMRFPGAMATRGFAQSLGGMMGGALAPPQGVATGIQGLAEQVLPAGLEGLAGAAVPWTLALAAKAREALVPESLNLAQERLAAEVPGLFQAAAEAINPPSRRVSKAMGRLGPRIPVSGRTVGQTAMEDLPSMVGQSIPFLAAPGGIPTAMGLGSLTAAGSSYADTLARTGDRKKAWTAYVANAGPGILEGVDPAIAGGVLNRIVEKVGGGLVAKILVNGLAEGLSEGGQEVVQEYVASKLDGEERDLWQVFAQVALPAAAFGGLAGGPSALQDRVRGKQAPGAAEAERRAGARTEPVERRPLEGAAPEVQAEIEALAGEARKAKPVEGTETTQLGEAEGLRAVQPATPAETWATEIGAKIGTPIILVERTGGGRLPLTGKRTAAGILLDANQPSEALLKGVALHELVHEVGARDPASFQALYDELGRIDAEGLALAEKRARIEHEAAGVPYEPGTGLAAEEAVARHAETLTGYLDLRLSDPEGLARLFEQKPGIARRIIDWLRDTLRSLGLLKQGMSTRLNRIARQVAVSEEELALDPERARAAADVIAEAYGALGRTAATPPQTAAVPPQTPAVEPEVSAEEAVGRVAAAKMEPKPVIALPGRIRPARGGGEVIRAEPEAFTTAAEEARGKRRSTLKAEGRRLQALAAEPEAQALASEYAAASSVRQKAIQEELSDRANVRLTPEEIGSLARGEVSFATPTGEPRFAVARPENGVWRFDLPDETVANFLTRRFIDKAKRVGVVQAAVEAQAGAIPESADLKQQIDLYQRRLGARARSLQHAEDRIVRIARKTKLSLDEIAKDLYAVHAPYREAHDVKAGFPGGVSAAKALTAKNDAGPNAKAFREIREINREINRFVLGELVDSGEISQATREAWEEKFGPDYLPLRDEDPEELSGGVTMGRGFQSRGPLFKQAKGRASEAGNVLVNRIQGAHGALVRAEKNRVYNRLHNLVTAYPDEAQWRVVPRRRNEDGSLSKDPDISFRERDEVLAGKIGGEQAYVQITDPLFRRALTNMGVPQSGPFMEFVHKAVRMYANTITTWNPEFIVTNFLRDAQQAGLLLTGEQGQAFTRVVYSGLPSKFKAALAVERNPASPGKLQDLYRQYVADGGRMGWTERLSWEQKENTLKKAIEGAEWKRIVKAGADVIGDVNSSVENLLRFSTYMAALDKGWSRPKAAQLAANLTVNFNRHGELGPAISSMYLFANASIQGSARIVSALKSPKVRAIAAGVTALGFAQSFLNRIAGGEDDTGEDWWAQVDDWRKLSRMHFWLPGKHEGPSVPLPWGFNVFYGLGVSLEDLAFGNQSVARSSKMAGLAALDAFNPLGLSDNLLSMLSPTIARPFVEQATNTDAFGRPIMPAEDPWSKIGTPASQRYWPSVSPSAKEVTDFLHETTGGTKVEGGLVEISPEQIEHFAGWLGGGVGRTGLSALDFADRLVRGEELDVNRIPILRRVYSKLDEARATRQRFREEQEKIETYKKYESLVKKGGATEADMERFRVLREKGLGPLTARARLYEKRLSALYKKRDAVETEEQRRAINDQITTLMASFNRQAAGAR